MLLAGRTSCGSSRGIVSSSLRIVWFGATSSNFTSTSSLLCCASIWGTLDYHTSLCVVVFPFFRLFRCLVSVTHVHSDLVRAEFSSSVTSLTSTVGRRNHFKWLLQRTKQQRRRGPLTNCLKTLLCPCSFSVRVCPRSILRSFFCFLFFIFVATLASWVT